MSRRLPRVRLTISAVDCEEQVSIPSGPRSPVDPARNRSCLSANGMSPISRMKTLSAGGCSLLPRFPPLRATVKDPGPR